MKLLCKMYVIIIFISERVILNNWLKKLKKANDETQELKNWRFVFSRISKPLHFCRQRPYVLQKCIFLEAVRCTEHYSRNKYFLCVPIYCVTMRWRQFLTIRIKTAIACSLKTLFEIQPIDQLGNF